MEQGWYGMILPCESRFWIFRIECMMLWNFLVRSVTRCFFLEQIWFYFLINKIFLWKNSVMFQLLLLFLITQVTLIVWFCSCDVRFSYTKLGRECITQHLHVHTTLLTVLHIASYICHYIDYPIWHRYNFRHMFIRWVCQIHWKRIPEAKQKVITRISNVTLLVQRIQHKYKWSLIMPLKWWSINRLIV